MSGNLITDPPDMDTYSHTYLGRTQFPKMPEVSEDSEWKRIAVFTFPASSVVHERAKARIESGGVLIVVDEDGVTSAYSPSYYRYFKVSPGAGE